MTTTYLQMHKLLYDTEEHEINEIILEENEVMESEIISSGLSHNIAENVPEVSAVVLDEDLDEFVSAAEALGLQRQQEDLDIRPYLFNGNSKRHILLDSGSQVCAWPPFFWFV